MLHTRHDERRPTLYTKRRMHPANLRHSKDITAGTTSTTGTATSTTADVSDKNQMQIIELHAPREAVRLIDTPTVIRGTMTNWNATKISASLAKISKQDEPHTLSRGMR